jgi:nitroreductase
MEFQQLVRRRRSWRGFTDQAVTEEQVGQIIEAARYAPSAINRQPWVFAVVRSRDVIEGSCPAFYSAEGIRSAAVLIVVCYDRDKLSDRDQGRGADFYGIQDTAAATQNMLLCAEDIGLNACWVGGYDENACRDYFGLSSKLRPVGIIAAGYGKTAPEPRRMRPAADVTLHL